MATERRADAAPILEISHLGKVFGDHVVLRDISLDVLPGEVISVIGSSGSGKSTMLRCVNLLETPTSGEIRYRGQDILRSEMPLTEYRAKVGMVFQQFNLFGNMNVLANCVRPQQIVLRRSREEAEENAMKYLEKVGMAAYVNARPSQLSGGQKQRVAIARALAKNPKILLCDEPTGALDYNTGKTILKLLQDTCRSTGRTVIVITHNQALTAMADRVIRVKSGTVLSNVVNPDPTPVERIEW